MTNCHDPHFPTQTLPARFKAQRALTRAALWLTLLLLCAPVSGVVIEDSAEKTYSVHPAPQQSLRDALNAATPIRHDGRLFYGDTAWNVTWNFWWNSDPAGRCRITRVETRLASTVQLPRLQRGTTTQLEAFERFERALRLHEQGHVQWGRTAAQAIDAGITSLPPAATCANLEQQANALGKRLLGEHIALEKGYDRSTGNGTTQGAALP